ncbi:MAG: HEAT repeat domain-containing protein [Methanococcaceae archaeon]
MNHEEYKELVQLSIYNELDEAEKSRLDQHLQECSECRAEMKELKNFSKLVAVSGVQNQADDTLLQEARSELRAALRLERNKKDIFQTISDAVRHFFLFNYKLAFGGAATLAVGLIAGYLLFAPKMQEKKLVPADTASGTEQVAQERIKINNLQVNKSDEKTGEIDLSFEAVKPVRVKGNINDARIQQVLARSLLSEKNDGIKLRTINTIAESAGKAGQPDKKIKQALISALRHDHNPGVRRQALLVLKQFPIDDEIKEAFLYVLSNDPNAGLRIAAINSLNIEDHKIDNNLLNILKQKSQTDNNEYIRIRAKAALQEVVLQ